MNSTGDEIHDVNSEIDFPGSDEYDIVSGFELGLKIQKTVDSKSEINTTPDSATEDLSYSSNTSSLRHYEDEWNQMYGKNEIDLAELKLKAIEGELRTNRFRSICWRCLLGILSKHPNHWVYQLQTYRKHYFDVRAELEKTPWNIKQSIPFDNPLSQESESIWQKYFCDKELEAVIHQDVIRTFPGVDFFRSETIQQMMVRILFCYARQNPALCYRQGMHEILAPLLFILHCDHQALLLSKEQSNISGVITEILDPESIEPDAYTIFKHIMSHIESSYRINQMVNSSGYIPSSDENRENKICENEAITRLEYIKENLLKPNDPDLTKHLNDLDISLQLFGIRWLRLLFGREFPLEDLLVLWDAIFAEENFELVNYIVVAMLIAIRNQLLSGDYTTCLTSLMRYPVGVDVSFVIEHALHLKDPQKHPPPAVISFPNLPVINVSKNRANRVHPQVRKYIENLDTNISRNARLKNSPSRSTIDLPPRPKNIGRNGEGDVNVVDGFTLDDPLWLKAELEHAQAVMNLVQIKLSQYHSTLASNLPQNLNIEAQQALDGLCELSFLLKSRQNQTSAEIEPAYEAGEVKVGKPSVPNAMVQSADGIKPTSSSINTEKFNTLPKLHKKPTSAALIVFKHTTGGPINGAPMQDPLRSAKAQDSEEEEFHDLLKELIKPSNSKSK